MRRTNRQCTKGPHELGSGSFAWLLPEGHWGYSNSGLITDGANALLVDTLFDVAHTREMLDGYRAATAAANHVGVLVNTHSRGNHTDGKQLLPGTRIAASRVCAEEMALPFSRPEERVALMPMRRSGERAPRPQRHHRGRASGSNPP